MPITFAEAEEIFHSMVEKPALRAHMRSVSLVMGALADKLGEQRLPWEIAGLLHDADIEALRPHEQSLFA